jgi:hypothetical protein
VEQVKTAMKSMAYNQAGIPMGKGKTVMLPPGNKKIEANMIPQTPPEEPNAWYT